MGQVGMLLALALLALVLRREPEVPPPPPCRPSPGCVVLEPGEPIVLGTLLVTRGESASLGTDSRYGVILAVEERRSILGHPIEEIHANDGCNAQGGARGARQLGREPDLLAVVGTSCTSAAVPATDFLGPRQILMVSPSNTRPDLTAPGTHLPFYARTAHNDRVQGEAAATYAWEQLMARSAVTVSDGTPYAGSLEAAFHRRFTHLGRSVTDRLRVPPDLSEATARALLKTVGRPDVLYLPLFVDEGATMIRAARSLDTLSETQIIGADGLFTPDRFRAVGQDNLEGLHISGPDLAGSSSDPAYEAFLERYADRFGEEPQSVFHAHAYDAANLIVDAIQRVARKDPAGRLHISRTELYASFIRTRGYRGLSGTITCTPLGDCGHRPPICIHAVYTGPGDISDPGWCDREHKR